MNLQNYLFGALSAIASMVGLSIWSIISTFLYQNQSTNSVDMSMLYGGLGQFTVSFVIAMVGGHSRLFFPPNEENQYGLWELFTLFVIALTSIAAVFTRYNAVKFIGPTTFSFIRTANIVITYIAQIIFFHAVPNYTSIIGAFFIMIVCAMITCEKRIVSFLPEKIQPFF